MFRKSLKSNLAKKITYLTKTYKLLFQNHLRVEQALLIEYTIYYLIGRIYNI